MTDSKSADSTRPVNAENVDKTVKHLYEGIASRSLQKLMDDLDEQRRTDPGGMKDLLAAVNQRVAKDFGNFAIADSGSPDRLRVEDPNHLRSVTLRADGKPLSYDKPVIKAGPAAVSDLMALPSYSNVSPPGLAELPPGAEVKPIGRPADFTLNGNEVIDGRGKFTVLERQSQATKNADGSTTYKYKGLLDSSFVSDLGNDHKPLLKTGNVHFNGAETISSDGKVLNRQVEYQPASQKRTLSGFMMTPSYGTDSWQKRTLNTMKAEFANYGTTKANANDVQSIDTAFNPATSRYDTTAKYLNGRELHFLNDTTGKKISISASDCNGSFAGTKSGVDEERDANGFVTKAYRPRDTFQSFRDKSIDIKRDADEEVTEFTDAHNKTSKRIEPDAQGNNWVGPDGPFRAEVFTDNAGNVVQKTADGAKIIGTNGDYTWVDKQGNILRRHSKIGTKFEDDTTYKLDAQGQSIGYVMTTNHKGLDGEVSRVNYEVSTKPVPPLKRPLPLMTRHQDYCVELK